MIAALPRLCVSLLTYNHRDFIGEAIDSVLAQETDFPFAIHIGDDFSTDGTREIIQGYRKAHPDRIVLNLAPKRGAGRIGRENNIRNLDSCRGAEFIAMLDGDDVWTDPHKLQRQVDFLDANAGYSCIGHDAEHYESETGRIVGRVSDAMPRLKKWRARRTGLVDLDIATLFRFMPQTSTLCFRSRSLPSFPEWFWQVSSADRAIVMMLSDDGKVGFDLRPMSKYRIHAESEWQRIERQTDILDEWVKIKFDTLLSEFPDANVGRNRADHELFKMRRARKAGSYSEALHHFGRAIRVYPPILAFAARARLKRLRRAR